MKQVILLLSTLPSILFAQIGQIQTHEKPGEFIYSCVYHDKPSDSYYLHSQSDNQFEDDVLRVFLGKNSTDAVQSLANFLAAFANEGTQFELSGYTFIVATSGTFVRVLNRGRLQYTAGNYYIYKKNIEDAIVFLTNSRGADAGRCIFYADKLSEGKLKFDMLDYGVINAWLNFKTDLRPFTSKRYIHGDVISDDDICNMRKAMLDNQLYICNIIMTQSICDSIIVE